MSVGILHPIIVICYISILIAKISIICKTPVRRTVGIVDTATVGVDVASRIDTIRTTPTRVRRAVGIVYTIDVAAAVRSYVPRVVDTIRDRRTKKRG